MLRVAAAQLVSSALIDKNLQSLEPLLDQAIHEQIQLLVLPENVLYFGRSDGLPLEQQTELIRFFSQWCESSGIWLVAGTLPLHDEIFELGGVQTDDYTLRQPADLNALAPTDLVKPFAASLLFDGAGKVVSIYRKLHLFDAEVNDNTRSYRESDFYRAGSQLGLASTPWCNVGLSVCYDLRFPEYYRELATRGAQVFCVPSAFTHVTGRAHWQILNRARAIENQCFLVAANQGGRHDSARRTWGHSMIVSPWGDVMAEMGEGNGLISAELDFDEQDRIRTEMPCTKHRRIDLFGAHFNA